MGTTKIVAEPGLPFIEITREFAAPPDLLLRAYTEPDLLVQWLGPRNLTMTIEHYDLRHGGSYHFTHTEADGTAHGFRGVFHGEPSVDSFVRTFEWEGLPGHISLERLTLEPRGDATLVRTLSIFQSVEDRDGMIASEMESGVTEGYDRLDELVANLTG